MNVARSSGPEKRAVRILHVLGGMDRGGVETWLMHVLRHIDRQRFQMDFAVNIERRCAYDDEIEALGSKIYPCPTPSNPLRYAHNFLKILREHGPYDVVHSHVHHYSGFVLFLAKRASVPVRIAHSHSDTSSLDDRSSSVRRLYLGSSRRWIARYASTKLAASQEAASSLFGTSWAASAGTSLLYCGIDLTPFDVPVDRITLRRELGLGPDDFVIGHVGRFCAVKNHEFLLRIQSEVCKLETKAKLFLVGKGPLEKKIRDIARSLGLQDSVRFAGVRDDIPRLMLGAMDVFVLPSLHEGLPLVAIEAQAAGLPTFLSETVSREADFSIGLVRFISPDSSPRDWALAILGQRKKRSDYPGAEAVALLKKSHFAIERSVANLCGVYAPALGR
jgi:glycosyltransferase involved in cell wall biosynthesis